MDMINKVLKDWFLDKVTAVMPSYQEMALVRKQDKFFYAMPETIDMKIAQYKVACCEFHPDKLEYYKRVVMPSLGTDKVTTVCKLIDSSDAEFISIYQTIADVWFEVMQLPKGRVAAFDSLNVSAIIDVMRQTITGRLITDKLKNALKDSVFKSPLVNTKAITSNEEWGVIDTILPYLVMAVDVENTDYSHDMAIRTLTHLYYTSTMRVQHANDTIVDMLVASGKYPLSYYGQNPARVIKPVYWRIWGLLPLEVDVSESFWYSDMVSNLRKSGIL